MKKTVGTGYTEAQIVADRLANDKFIGYLPTKGEYIIATYFQPSGYGWSKYFMNKLDLIDHLREQGNDALALTVAEYSYVK